MFSVTDAAFAGFQVIRRNPMTLVWWTGVALIFSIASAALMVLVAGDALQTLSSADSSNPDFEGMMSAYARLAPVFLILLPVSLLYYGVFAAGVSRAVLRPEDPRFGFLRLGGAEFTQTLLILVLGLILFAGYIGFLIVGFLATMLITMLFALLGSVGSMIGAALGVVVMLVIFVGGELALWTRFSLASPQTFATGSFNLGGSWGLTKKPFWPMFGAYVLAFIVAGLIALLLYGAFAGAVFVAGGWTAVVQAFGPDMTSVEGLLKPTTMIYYLIAAVASSLMGIIGGSPAAYIYDQLTGSRQQEVFA
jgi:hypothetical protein